MQSIEVAYLVLYGWLQPHWEVIKWLGGPSALGGTYFWHINRIRANVREFMAAGVDARFISFEAENINEKITSLQPTFMLVGYTPKRERQVYTFTIQDKDRSLAPHKATLFTAAHSSPENRLIFSLWYLTFTVPLTRGVTTKLRVRNRGFEPLGLLPFYWDFLRFRLSGHIPDEPKHTLNTKIAAIAEQQAQETLIAGTPAHPDLAEHSHRVAVVQCKLVNQSKVTKAQVTKVTAHQRNDDELPITWSNGIDELGNPTYCGNLVVVDDEATLYLRHNWGQSINYARIVIEHNMPGSPTVVVLDDWYAVGPNPFKGS